LQLQFSASGEHLLFTNRDNHLVHWDWKQHEQTKITEGAQFFGPWALASDNRRVAYSRGGLAVYDLRADRAVLELAAEGTEIWCVDWNQLQEIGLDVPGLAP
jgi:hypothetical protein